MAPKYDDKRLRLVWKVNQSGDVVEEVGITEAGRRMVRNMPEGHKKSHWTTNGSYQGVIRPYLDRCIQVDDRGNRVASGGYFWMTRPPQSLCNAIIWKRVAKNQEARQQQSIMDLKAEVTAIKNALQVKEREIAKAQDLMNQMTTQGNALAAEVHSLRAASTDNDKEKFQLQSLLQLMRKEEAFREREMSRLRECVTQQTESINSLQGQIVVLENGLASAKEKETLQEAYASRCVQEIGELKAALEEEKERDERNSRITSGIIYGAILKMKDNLADTMKAVDAFEEFVKQL
jgi:hypothetical protein